MDKYIKTNRLKKIDESKFKLYSLYKMNRVSYDLLSEIYEDKNVLSFYRLQNDTEQVDYKHGSYIFLVKKDLDFKEIYLNGSETIEPTDIQNYILWNLMLRSVSKIGQGYFLNSYTNNLSVKIDLDINKKIIKALSFDVSKDMYLSINLTTYENYENVLNSYSGYSKQENLIKKADKFKYNEKNNILIKDVGGVWINKRSKNFKKSSVNLISDDLETTKLSSLYKLNIYLKELGFMDLQLESELFTRWNKTSYWNNKNKEYIKIIERFIDSNTFELINETKNPNLIKNFKDKIQKEGINIKFGKSNKKIILIRNEKDFKIKNEEDNYIELKKDNKVSQMITEESVNNLNKVKFLNIIKELIIKEDVYNRKSKMFNQKDFEYYSCTDFHENEEDNDYIYFMIQKNGEMSFDKILKRKFFREFKDLKIKRDNFKGLLIFNQKRYVINETKKAVYPDIEDFFSNLYENDLNKRKILNVKDVENIKHIKEQEYKKLLFINKETVSLKNKKEKLVSYLNFLNDVIKILSKRKFNFIDFEAYLKTNVLYDRSKLQDLKESLGLSFYYRNDDVGSFHNFTLLWTNKNEYFTGSATAVETKYAKLNYVYSVSGDDIDEDFISFLDNVFVKHKGLANLPFPDKLIREYFSSFKK